MANAGRYANRFGDGECGAPALVPGPVPVPRRGQRRNVRGPGAPAQAAENDGDGDSDNGDGRRRKNANRRWPPRQTLENVMKTLSPAQLHEMSVAMSKPCAVIPLDETLVRSLHSAAAIALCETRHNYAGKDGITHSQAMELAYARDDEDIRAEHDGAEQDESEHAMDVGVPGTE